MREPGYGPRKSQPIKVIPAVQMIEVSKSGFSILERSMMEL